MSKTNRKFIKEEWEIRSKEPATVVRAIAKVNELSWSIIEKIEQPLTQNIRTRAIKWDSGIRGKLDEK